MVSSDATVEIQRPLHEVFAFVARGENAGRWRSSVVSTRLREGTEGEVGAVYEQRMKGPLGGDVDADYEITHVEPERELQFRAVGGPIRPTGRFVFAGDHTSTTVSMRLECELSGMGHLMAPMIAKAMQSETASLQELKRVLETP